MQTPSPETGWPFWWRWVLWTNLGWFSGIALGMLAAQSLPSLSATGAATLTAALAALFFGVAQALTLRSFLPDLRLWWAASVVGWTLGIFIARQLIDSVFAAGLPTAVDLVASATIAGAILGILQAPLLRGVTSRWRAWPLVSAIGWGVMFPGALPGAVLVWAARNAPAEPREG